MAMTKVKALQLWCKKMADGYRDVEVRDMAASWKSGLAFCAIIHRFRPDLIDYDSLSKENVFDNNQLAFEVAEKMLNIPAFLEAADMVAIRVPDKLSVVTYVSQYYNYFHDKPQLGGPGVSKVVSPVKQKEKTPVADDNSLKTAKTNVDNSQMKKERQESMGDKCSMCHEKVYLLERQIENAKLYHRSCFRKSELSPTSKVFKKHPYTAIEEEKNGFPSSKLRKIDTEKKMETNEKKDSGPDFWERRAQEKAKAKQTSEAAKKTEVKVELKSDSQTNASDVPAWKRVNDKNSEIKLGKTEDKKPVINPANVNGANKTVASPAKPTGLANKFKELNERNLKASNGAEKASDNIKGSDKNKTSLAPDKITTGSKVEESASHAPLPRPRNNVPKTFEKMDTNERTAPVSQPKAARRLPKYGMAVSPTASPRNIESKPKSPPVKKKTIFTRPKTPPQSHKAEFSLNLSKQEKHVAEEDNSPSSPPPLPHTSPPKLTPSQSPKHPSSSQQKKIDFDKSPMSSPRSGEKNSPVLLKNRNKNDIHEPKIPARPHMAPSKPPRAVSSYTERSSSPMDTNEKPVPSKAVIHEPSVEHKAILVEPKRHNPDGENKNLEVFGGLLKSLAVVRNKHDAEIGDTLKSVTTDKPVNDTDQKTLGVNKYEEKVKITVKEKQEEKKDNPKRLPQRPKSSFVMQSSNLFDDSGDKKESHGKGKVSITKTTVTTTVVKTNEKVTDKHVKKTEVPQVQPDSDIPAWKRQLDAKRTEKERPKSADILGEKSKQSDSMLEWQKEAEKRKQARKGGYVDPEKGLQNLNTNSHVSDLSRPLSPLQKKSPDTHDQYIPQKTKDDEREKAKSPERRKLYPLANNNIPSPKEEETNKKKISVDRTFVFEDIEMKTDKKPSRQGPTSPLPASPRSSKSPPSRPPPPKTGGTLSKTVPVKHHLTASQIQKQLQLIDSKLTQLELTGRTLEDSIRNAKEEEDDDLMISWFQIVNEKNELVRKECDYIYISRSQELELQQQQIDQQIRDLDAKAESAWTEADIKEEEYLMEKLLDIVNQRSKIVDSIDEDRLRYLEEDRDIEAMLQKKGFLKEIKDGGKSKKDKKKSD